MSSIKIEHIDGNSNLEFKKWTVNARVEYKDVIEDELSKREVLSLLEKTLRQDWEEFLTILQVRGVNTLKIKQQDRHESSFLVSNGAFPLIVNKLFEGGDTGYTLYSEIDCDYTGDLRLKVRSS